MTYELRPLSFGELLDTGFRIFRNHFQLLFGLAAVVYIPLGLIGTIVSTAVSTAGPAALPEASVALVLAGVGVAAVVLFLMLAWPVTASAITHAVGELYLGRTVAVGSSLRLGFSILLPVMGTTLLSYLMISGGLLLLVIPGIYLALAYMLIWQIMVIERVFGMQALRRSRDLMRGNKLRGVGIMVVYGLIISVPNSLLTLALHAYPTVASLASTVVQAAGFAFLCALSVVLYFDIRCRKEAFDLEHLADLVAQRAPSPAPVRRET